jgi:multidrug efflux pump subunit AcrA (membrane-fusion protein)
MFVRANITLGPPSKKIFIDDKSIVNRRNQEGVVFIVHGQTLEERKVSFGELYGENREVLSGIKKGELVVVRPQNDFENNLQVSVVKNAGLNL